MKKSSHAKPHIRYIDGTIILSASAPHACFTGCANTGPKLYVRKHTRCSVHDISAVSFVNHSSTHHPKNASDMLFLPPRRLARDDTVTEATKLKPSAHPYFQVVLCSDCLYDLATFPTFKQALVTVCGPSTLVLMAYKRRLDR